MRTGSTEGKRAQPSSFPFRVNDQWMLDKNPTGPFSFDRKVLEGKASFRFATEVFEKMIDHLNAKALKAWEKNPSTKTGPWQDPAWLKTLMEGKEDDGMSPTFLAK